MACHGSMLREAHASAWVREWPRPAVAQDTRLFGQCAHQGNERVYGTERLVLERLQSTEITACPGGNRLENQHRNHTGTGVLSAASLGGPASRASVLSVL